MAIRIFSAKDYLRFRASLLAIDMACDFAMRSAAIISKAAEIFGRGIAIA